MDLTFLVIFLFILWSISLWLQYIVWFKAEKFNNDFRKLGMITNKGTGIVKIMNKTMYVLGAYGRYKNEKYIAFNLWWARIVGLIMLIISTILLAYYFGAILPGYPVKY